MTRPSEMRAAADELAQQFADLTAAAFEEACRAFWQTYGTLPKPLPKLRRLALRAIRAEATANGIKVGFIARKYGFSPNRFSRLTSGAAA